MKLLANLLGMLFSREEEIEERYSHCPLCSFLGTELEVKEHIKIQHNL